MSARLSVVFPGAMASLQDLGRTGLRRAGVPRAGALEPGWLRLANALLGNPQSTAAIEFFGGGLVLRALDGPVRLSLAGPFSAEVIAADGSPRRSIGSGSWCSLTLAADEQLRCGMVQGARAGYVAVQGLQAPLLLGSASTYARAGLGRQLVAGVVLLVDGGGGAGEWQLANPPKLPDERPIRVVPGPQADFFTEDARQAFFAGEYQVTRESDRMGMRLEGALLAHRPDKGSEITSDATVPGSIQVPGKGQPIVLLNDGQTAGGYPKIATVISADLPRLALRSPGDVVRFVPVSVAEGEHAAREGEIALSAMMAAMVPAVEPGEIDLEALYSGNLLSGMVNALARD